MTASIVSYTARNATTASGASFALTTPTGTLDGDLLVAIVIGQSASWTPPAGWTTALTDTGFGVYQKIAASEPATSTFVQSTSTAKHGYMITVRGALYDVSGTISSGASPSVAPSVTATSDACIVFDLAYVRNVSGVTYSTPSGFTFLAAAGGTITVSSSVFYRSAAAAGPTGTASTNPSGGTLSRSVQLVVKSSPYAITPTGDTGTGFAGAASLEALLALLSGVGVTAYVGTTPPAGAIRIAAVDLQGVGAVGSALVWGMVQTGATTVWIPVTTPTAELWALVDSTQNPGWTG